jgi:hypothetical protein
MEKKKYQTHKELSEIKDIKNQKSKIKNQKSKINNP